MKILVTGATGLIGKTILKKLNDQGHEVYITTRDVSKAKEIIKSNATLIEWKDYYTLPNLIEIKSLDGVIHLMGENIGNKRWSDEQKKILIDSRVDATKNLIRSINNQKLDISFFISASAIGIYPSNEETIINEESNLGSGFLSQLCKEWENASNELNPHVRKVNFRTGVVLDKNGGALKKMLPPFYMGVGGILGNGEQYMSWIHYEDMANLYIEAATNDKYKGIYNAVNPNPITNFQFTKALGKAINRPTIFPVPSIIIQTLFGEMSTIILDSQRVTTNRIPIDFFKYKDIESTLENILK